MALLTWDSSYSVSVKSCDFEHQKLFSLVNQLNEAMKVGKGRAILADIVRELEKYTQTHFYAEEALMLRSNYPDLAPHRLQHQEFVKKVSGFRKELESGDSGDSLEVLSFLQGWLANHILKTDKMYSSHLNSNGIN